MENKTFMQLVIIIAFVVIVTATIGYTILIEQEKQSLKSFCEDIGYTYQGNYQCYQIQGDNVIVRELKLIDGEFYFLKVS